MDAEWEILMDIDWDRYFLRHLALADSNRGSFLSGSMDPLVSGASKGH
jgi:hypothetical protein